jgi:hypothetical protein
VGGSPQEEADAIKVFTKEPFRLPNMPPKGKGKLIVYGARCCWWNTIDRAGRLGGQPHGLPCCPYCESPLFEIAEELWWEQAQEVEDNGRDNYVDFVKWLQGKCLISGARLYNMWKEDIRGK